MNPEDYANQIRTKLVQKVDRQRATLDDLADAAAQLAAAEATYATTYAAALEAGWQQADLKRVGVKPPTATTTRRRRPPRPTQSAQPPAAHEQ